MKINKDVLLFDTYRVLEEIGSGGGGVVYKAYHERLKKYVVIKQIKDCVKGVLESRAEADILKNLSHTYLPQVFDFLMVENDIYTVLDYIPGTSLEQAIEDHGRYDEKTVLKWANQLADALSYLHSQIPAIVHSDIKPANIMLRPNGDICLIDFNVSLAFDAGMRTSTGVSSSYSPPEQYWNYEMYCSMTETSSVKNPPSWKNSERKTMLVDEADYAEPASAEKERRVTMLVTEHDSAVQNSVQSSAQIQNSRHHTERVTSLLGRGVDERSDIYSLGATLYHLLTGAAPDEIFDEIIPISKTKVSVSEGFAFIIEKMMQITPEERYQNGMELSEALRNIYELDSVYRSYRHKRLVGGLMIAALYAASAGLILGGVNIVKKERINAYNLQIESINTLIGAGDFAKAEEEIQAAIESNPTRIDAYVKKLQKHYYAAEYEKCIQCGREIINSPQYQIQTDADKAILADAFYLLGNAYYEMEDMANAVSCFSEAIRWNSSNAAYYRDYSISLAKTGNLNQAEEMLKEAVSHGMGQDSLYMSQGEIAYAGNDYKKARECFENALSSTEDEQLIRRCVLLADRTYQMLGDQSLSDEIAFLEKWENTLNSKGSYQISERLANAYSRNGSYEKAIEKIRSLINSGYRTYQTMTNLTILCQQNGQMGEAEDILKEMLSQYPDRYETYKRLAFLEADKQQSRDNKQRDYHKMKEYYDDAIEIYQRMNVYDDEMQVLDTLMQDVRDGNWLN